MAGAIIIDLIRTNRTDTGREAYLLQRTFGKTPNGTQRTVAKSDQVQELTAPEAVKPKDQTLADAVLNISRAAENLPGSALNISGISGGMQDFHLSLTVPRSALDLGSIAFLLKELTEKHPPTHMSDYSEHHPECRGHGEPKANFVGVAG